MTSEELIESLTELAQKDGVVGTDMNIHPAAIAADELRMFYEAEEAAKKAIGENGVEVGAVTAHPIMQMWLQIKTIFVTWRDCKKNGAPYNKWYGVYPVGSEKILAQVGPLPDAESRAKKIAAALSV